MLIRRTTRYMLGLLLWPTVLITFSLSAIVWLMQALRFVDFIINRGLSVGDFLYLTMLILPSLLTIIMPIALLIAVVFVYHKLHGESELTVMQASGMSRMRLARPAMLAGLAMTALTYLFTLQLLPTANRQFKDMREFLRDNYASVLLQEEVFNHPVDGMTVFIRERSDTGKLRGILVHDNRDPNNVITMMADESILAQTPSGPKFLLERGLRQEKRDGRISWLNFDSYNLDLSYYTQTKMNRQRDEGELYLHELLTKESGKYQAEAHKRLTWPWFSLALPLLAVALITGGQFNRRGMWRRIAMISTISLTCVLGFFGLINTLVTIPAALYALYAYLLAIMGYAIALLLGIKWPVHHRPVPAST